MTYIFGDLGRSWSIFRDLGSKDKILLGSRGNYFQGSGEINALFSGIKGAQTPLWGASPKAEPYMYGTVLQLYYVHILKTECWGTPILIFDYDGRYVVVRCV